MRSNRKTTASHRSCLTTGTLEEKKEIQKEHLKKKSKANRALTSLIHQKKKNVVVILRVCVEEKGNCFPPNTMSLYKHSGLRTPRSSTETRRKKDILVRSSFGENACLTGGRPRLSPTGLPVPRWGRQRRHRPRPPPLAAPLRPTSASSPGARCQRPRS